MSYEAFSHVYDQLMTDVPYQEWLQWAKQSTRQAEKKNAKVLDLACGTGTVSLLLHHAGFNVTGIDLSEEMLTIAEGKAYEAGFSIPFILQDMRELNVYGKFDGIFIFLDSLNYLREESEVKRTFEKVFHHLQDDGVFLFDVHSPYKMEHIFKNNQFSFADEDICYIWDCFEGDFDFSVWHELNFFVKNEMNTYDRFEETHFQRTYLPEVYKNWLEEAGFKHIQIACDTTGTPITKNSERIYFTVRK